MRYLLVQEAELELTIISGNKFSQYKKLIYYFSIFGISVSSLFSRINNPITIQDSVEFISSNIPIVIIDTDDQTIVDPYRITAEMGIINNGPGNRNYLTDPYNNYNGLIAIELRGSTSSWYPKEQYRLETQDSLGNNLNVPLLGMPSENDWILNGPYLDQSLIRNVIAYNLSNDIGRYASRTRFCELVLNGDYRGMYVLMEKIKRDNNRVDISRMDADDISGDSLTGGYIIKIDKWDGENVGGWTSSGSTQYQYHYPKANTIMPEQQEYIQNLMDDFEAVMNGSDYNDPEVGYPNLIDVASAVDHFILNEYCKNVDAYRISSFIYKNRDSEGGKLTFGPIWDFNLSLGRTFWYWDLYKSDGWQIDYNYEYPGDPYLVPFWWEKIGHDSTFASLVLIRWNELSAGLLNIDSIYQRIDILVDTLAEARARNFIRWPDSNLIYDEEIQNLKAWINDRTAWIDNHINQLAVATGNTDPAAVPHKYILRQNYPNPFNSMTTIDYVLTQSSRVILKIYSVSGIEVCTLVNQYQKRGDKSINWEGKDDFGRKVSSGVYIYQLKVDNQTNTKKMLLLK